MKGSHSSMKQLIVAILFLAAATSAQSADKLNVITATQDLASIASEIGGDHITAESIAKGYQDPHFVEPKPSFLLKLKKADLLAVVGLQLEIGWLPPLITQSGNSKIQASNAGYLDMSQFCEVLEIPTTQVTRAMGDVHPLGNPHYWLNPENGRRMAKAFQNKFSEMRPGDAAYFAARYADFDKRLTEAEKRWDAQMAPYKGRKVITYHRSWPNFCERFGMVVVDYVEPKPGIPPTPSHTLDVINIMKRENIKLIHGGALFRFAHTQFHRFGNWWRGCGAAAFGGRHQRSDRLFQALRLRYQFVDQRIREG